MARYHLNSCRKPARTLASVTGNTVAAYCRFCGTARRRPSPFSAAAFALVGCSLGVGGNGYSSASKRFLLSQLFYRRGGAFVKAEGCILRKAAAGAGGRCGRQPRRPAVGERGAPAGAPRLGGFAAGLPPVPKPSARFFIFHGCPACCRRPAAAGRGPLRRFGQSPAAAPPHRGSAARGAESGTA